MEIVTCHYKENLEWLKQQSDYKVIIVHKEGGDVVDYTYCIPNIGLEATAFLYYIIERYDTLPDHVAFIHGHENAGHQLGDRSLLDMIRTATINKYSFIPLNNLWRFCFKGQFNHVCKEMYEWMGIIVPDIFIACSGAQFIVAKHLILRNTKQFYMDLYKKIKTRDDALIMEYSWHFLLTGESTTPHDDFFIPPMKEKCISPSTSIPLHVKDLNLCYIGKMPPSSKYVKHIKNSTDENYYNYRGGQFFYFVEDEIEHAIGDMNKVAKIPKNNFINFVHGYIRQCQYCENFYMSQIIN